MPITESGRSTPASQTSVNVQEAQTPSAAEVIVNNNSAANANLVFDPPLIEVSEEEDEKSSSTTTLSHNSESSRASSVPKDIKESQNYEKQKQTKKVSLLRSFLCAPFGSLPSISFYALPYSPICAP